MCDYLINLSWKNIQWKTPLKSNYGLQLKETQWNESFFCNTSQAGMLWFNMDENQIKSSFLSVLKMPSRIYVIVGVYGVLSQIITVLLAQIYFIRGLIITSQLVDWGGERNNKSEKKNK